MTYEQLIEKLLAGKSVNARAKEIGIAQRTLDNYVKAESIPGCDAAIVIAQAAGVSIEDAVKAIAEKAKQVRPRRASTFLRPAIASVLALVTSVNLFLTPSPAEAAPVLKQVSSMLCIM